MPLIDLKTDLKSLKYGADRPGGGNSGQPYMKVDINTVDRGLNRLRFTNFDDGLVRGGIVGATNASIVDTLRIGKWLTDLPKGPLWIAKQALMQFSNPKLEFKKINTGSRVFNNIVNFVQDKIGLIPTRIYNFGINTIAQIPVNAFGVHFNRHGILPVQDDSTKYLSVAQHNNQGRGQNNRLVGLTNKFNLGTSGTRIVLGRRETGTLLSTLLSLGEAAANFVLTNNVLPERSSKIDDYVGGPGSVYGVGRTLIRRYDYTRTITQANADKTNPYKPQIDINLRGDLVAKGPSIQVYGSAALARLPRVSPLKTYQQIKKQNDTQATRGVFGFNPFKNTANLGAGGFDFYNGEIGNYTNNTVEYRNGIDAKLRFNGNWKSLNREKRVGSGRQDQINLTPLFNSKAGTISDRILIDGFGYKEIRDLVKFRIQAINTDSPDIATWMIFRAYLTQFTDNVDAGWNDVKYVGRGESFYIYSGFTRRINIGFKVAALSAEEMKPMYQKLNYLMGNLMPDYRDNLMRGPLVRMTVGNYIDGQAGILNNLTYTVPQDSPWEIALAEPILGEKKLILPHIIEVNMTFTPIGSQTFKDNRISEKSSSTSHIAQNINDYQYIDGDVTSTSDLSILEGTETRKELISAAPTRGVLPSTSISNTPDLTRRDPLNPRSPLAAPVNLPSPPNLPRIVRGG